MKKSKLHCRRVRPAYLNRRGHNDDPNGDTLSTFFVIDLTGGPTINCESVRHAFSIAFGRNKRTRTQSYLPCMLTKDFFHILEGEEGNALK